MSWSHAKYVETVKKQAPAASRAALLQASSKDYNKAKYEGIYLTYYSMPDWLDVFDQAKRIEKMPFQHLVAEYRHVAGQYHQKVTKELDCMEGFASGRALLKEVGDSRFSLFIMPYFHYRKTMPGGDYFNATPRPLSPGEKLSNISEGTRPNSRDAYEKGAPVRDSDGTAVGGEVGTGKGANVVLFYSPETWQTSVRHGPGFKADEVLYHELVHISRMFRGRMTQTKVDGTAGYGNIEEYFATVVTNVYLSEKGNTQLRGIYANVTKPPEKHDVKINGQTVMTVICPLADNWNVMKDPDKFYQNPDKTSVSPRQLMQIFVDTQKVYYQALANLPDGRPKFNPVKQHFKENQRPDI